MGRGPGRPGKTRGLPHGLGRTAHIKPTSHGPRPGPVHQISSRWVATRPGASNLQTMGRGQVRPITFSKLSARPGPSHFQKSPPGPGRPITISKLSARLARSAHDMPGLLHYLIFALKLMKASVEASMEDFMEDMEASTQKYKRKLPRMLSRKLPWKLLARKLPWKQTPRKLPRRVRVGFRENFRESNFTPV